MARDGNRHLKKSFLQGEPLYILIFNFKNDSDSMLAFFSPVISFIAVVQAPGILENL